MLFRSRVLDMLTEDLHPWIYTLGRSISKETSVQITIDLAKAAGRLGDAIKATSLTLSLFSSGNPSRVFLRHSLDGTVWSTFDGYDGVRATTKNLGYFFPQAEFRYLQIVLTKIAHDRLGDQFYYDFGIDGILIGSVANLFEPTSILISNPITIGTLGGVSEFEKVSLKTCEHVPSGTSISYSISGKRGEEWTDFISINPQAQQILDFSDVNKDDILSLIDVSSQDATYQHLYKLEDPINDPESIDRIWRNVGSNKTWKRLHQSSDNQIIEAGWRKESRFYKTIGLVEGTQPIIIDFGPSKLNIDGIDRSGEVSLAPGLHEFTVSEENWYSLEGMVEVLEVNGKLVTGSRKYYDQTGLGDNELTQGTYTVIDPLYPYNHKLLIEGLVYNTTFKGQKIYNGVARFASEIMSRVQIEELSQFQNKIDYSIVKESGENRYNITVSWKSQDANPRELFLIETKQSSKLNTLKLKAVFTTNDKTKTPVLEGYEIRVL